MQDDHPSRFLGQAREHIAHELGVGMGENRLVGGIVHRAELLELLDV